MAIDTSGEWWIGSSPDDLHEYLSALTADSYRIDKFRLARCGCGGVAFHLEADPDEGAARRTCASCHKEHLICDSEEYWEDADPAAWECMECASNQTNVGVGFALYDDRQGIRWIYLGVRCARCGILGCFADWKVGGSSLQMMEQV